MEFLQIFGLIGMATLLFICTLLSLQRNAHIFLVVGQDVFKWMAVVLAAFILSRLLVMFGLATTDLSRNINSVMFLATVGGIVWSVRRHGRTK